jgi:hypothetical protein
MSRRPPNTKEGHANREVRASLPRGGAVAAQRAQQVASSSQPTPGPIATAAELGAELAEIAIGVGARVLRRALARLPRP